MCTVAGLVRWVAAVACTAAWENPLAAWAVAAGCLVACVAGELQGALAAAGAVESVGPLAAMWDSISCEILKDSWLM